MSFSSVPVSIHLHQSKAMEMMAEEFHFGGSFILIHTLCCVWEVAGPFL